MREPMRRGWCSECGREVAIRADGCARLHVPKRFDHWHGGWTVRSDLGLCPGAGLPGHIAVPLAEVEPAR